MDARIGDEIVIDSRHTGDTPRKGEIIEIMHEGGTVHYRVRWKDDHESIFFPRSDAHILHHGAVE